MPENLLQICWVLGLIIMTAVISVKSQSLTRYQAKIPFDFSIGQKTYKAGDYTINIRKSSTVVEWLLADSKGRNLQVFSILTKGKDSRNDQTSLLFKYYENQYFLTDMVSADYGLNSVKPVSERISTRNFGIRVLNPETASLIMK